MATFNPQQDDTQPQNYGYHSRGPDASPNTALGNLFSGLAQTLDTGVRAADQAEKKTILDDIQTQSDKIQNEFGVGAATDLQADASTGDTGQGQLTPPALQRAGSQLDSLQNAYMKGNLKESYYWARLNVMVRQLRAKYPGYSDQIDNMVSSVVGANPANALRSQLFNEWQSATTAAMNSPQAKLEDWATKQGYLPPDYFQRQDQGKPYSFEELQSYVAKKTSDKTQMDSQKAQLELQNSQNTLDQTQLENTYRLESSQLVTTLLGDTTKTVGANFAAVQSQIQQAEQEIASGKNPSADELQQLTVGMNTLRQQVQTQLHQQFISFPLYASRIDAKTEAEIQSQAMQPLDIMTKALSDQDFGVLKSMNAWIANQENDAKADIMKNIPMVQTLAAVNQTAGSQVASFVLSLNPDLQNSLAKQMISYAALKSVQDPNYHVEDAISDGEKTNQKADYFNALTTQWTNLAAKIGDPKTPAQVIKSSVQFMFGSDSAKTMAKLDDNSRLAWFNKVASPEVTQKMLQLKNSGDVDSWNTYQKWVSGAFISLFREQVQSLDAANQNGSFTAPDMIPGLGPNALNKALGGGISVTYSPQTYQFIMNSRGPLGMWDTSSPVGQWNPNGINQAIQRIVPILKENGIDPNKELVVLLNQMGWSGHGDTGGDKLMNALLDQVTGAQNG